MDPNETLRLFRVAMQDAREAADGDSNDAEIEALQDALGYAEALDEWLSKGGFLPDAWAQWHGEPEHGLDYRDTGHGYTGKCDCGEWETGEVETMNALLAIYGLHIRAAGVHYGKYRR